MRPDSDAALFPTLETPALLLEYDVVVRNIEAMAHTTESLGIDLRPHVKTHKLAQLAQLQLAAGACGVTVARLEEAAAMVDAGVHDVFLAYPIKSQQRLQHALRLAEAIRFVVAVEDADSAAWLDRHIDGSRSIGVMIEVDTGHHRCGVTSAEEATDLARRIVEYPHLQLQGIFTHEGHAYSGATREDSESIGRAAGRSMGEVAQTIRATGIEVPTVSVGCSVSVTSAGAQPGVTEARPGTYVFNDRSQVLHGMATYEDCAAMVLATVISRPVRDRVVIDAGSKSLALDVTLTNPPQRDYGHIMNHPGWRIDQLSEEHGVLLAADGADPMRPGDRLLIIPNHICPVVNLFDQVVLHQSGEILGTALTTGRSRQQCRAR